VQRAHDRAEEVDREPALDGGDLLDAVGRLRLYLGLRAPELFGEARDLGAKRL